MKCTCANLCTEIINTIEEDCISFANEIQQINEYSKGRWYGRLEGYKAGIEIINNIQVVGEEIILNK